MDAPIGRIDIQIDFFDRVRGKPPRFFEFERERSTCVPLGIDDCHKSSTEHFIGAYAIVNFTLKDKADSHPQPQLRERVRLLDQEDHLPKRALFEKSIEFRSGVGSDIQLFGYQDADSLFSADQPISSAAAWRLFRQDLFCGLSKEPFLILHWRHTLNQISLIDVIPVGSTQIHDDVTEGATDR